MNTAKEVAQMHTARLARIAAIKSARVWAENDRQYTADKICRKYTREGVKNARKANAKLVAIKRAGTVRPVGVVLSALLPLVDMARAGALSHAETVVAKVGNLITKHGGNVDAFAPEAERLSSADQWNKAKRLERDRINGYRSFVLSLCVNVNASAEYVYPAKAPKYALDAERVEDFTADCVRDAQCSFLAFAEKLTIKCGDVTTAKLDCNGSVWGYSFLTVTTATGATQIWKTQQITNVSCLGKYFPQWPSRVVKAVEL